MGFWMAAPPFGGRRRREGWGLIFGGIHSGGGFDFLVMGEAGQTEADNSGSEGDSNSPQNLVSGWCHKPRSHKPA